MRCATLATTASPSIGAKPSFFLDQAQIFACAG